MIKGFKERKPWAIVIVCLLLDVFTGMIYIGKGRLSLAYLAVSIALTTLPFIASYYEFPISPFAAIWLIPTFSLRIIGAIHAVKIRKGSSYSVAHKWYSRWYSILLLVGVIPITLAFAFRIFLFESFNSPAASMAPNVHIKDNFFVSKLTYTPKRGDVIAFIRKKNGTTYLKRIIGLPGDKVQMKGGLLYINESPVIREYLRDEAVTDASDTAATYKRYTETLPEGQKYDIYEVSDDERLDNTEQYVVPAGHYFTLGDNRDQSLDSRIIDEVGYVAEDKIIGKATYFFWKEKSQKVIWRPVK